MERKTNPLFLLKFVDLKRVTIITLTAGGMLLLAFIHLQNVEFEKTKLVYLRPGVSRQKARRRETGAVRIITRIVERPGGEKETTIDETRAPAVETETVSETLAPVPLAVTMAPRTDRWLLGVGLLDFSPNEVRNYRAFAGYSFKNRCDVFYGIGWDDRPRQSVNVMLRF